MKRITLCAGLMVLVLVMMTSCMPNPDQAMTQKPSGFFSGVWHGWIAPLSLIVGFFNEG